MSEYTVTGNTERCAGESANPDTRADDTAQLSIEERLAIARAQREKLLQSKGKKPAKPKPARPVFMAEDRATDLSYPGTSGFAPDSVKADLDPFPEEDDPFPEEDEPEQSIAFDRPPLQGRPSSAPSVEPEIVTPHSPAPRSVSVSWIVSVAIACFFGLGVGMVLSFGAVVAMGWVSVNEIAKGGDTPETAQPVSASTTAATFVAVPRAPRLVAATRFDHGEIAPMMGRAPAPDPLQFSTNAMDYVRTDVSTPRPVAAVDVALPEQGAITEVAALRDLGPDAPARPAPSPLRLASLQLGTDALPVLPEQSDIKLATALEGLEVPKIRSSLVEFGKARHVIRDPGVSPLIQASQPGAAPNTYWAQPARPSVIDLVVPDFSATRHIVPVALRSPADIQAPPARGLPTPAPDVDASGSALPTIGAPVERALTLAAQLGLRGPAAEKFTLVTFAPTNVDDERLALNAQSLETTGFPVSGVSRVDFRVSKTHVRYYHAADATVAQAIAEHVGGIARDFTTLRNAPPAGRVEVWLNGGRSASTVASAAPVVRTTRAAPARQATQAETAQQAAQRKAIENRLIKSLRRGDHLKGALN